MLTREHMCIIVINKGGLMNSEKKENRFDWKSFISFSLFFSFIIMSLTGLVLYITPPGRVAKWIIWTFAGLEKGEWEAVHTIFSYIFLIFGIFHIFSINWKALLFYFKKKKQNGLNRKKELIASSIIIIIGFFGTIYEIPPFKSVMDLGEYVKESWDKKDQEAPVSHTEAMMITELSEKIVKLTPQEIMKKLRSNNIKVKDAKQTLDEIGKENKISPFDIYKIIIKDSEIKKRNSSLFSRGSGFGRKTIADIAEALNENVEILIKRLKDAGINAEAGERIRDIAEDSGKRPSEIINLLNNVKKKKEK